MDLIAQGDLHVRNRADRGIPHDQIDPLENVAFSCSVFKAGTEILFSIVKTTTRRSQYGNEQHGLGLFRDHDFRESEDFGTVRIVGGYAEVAAGEAKKIEDRLRDASRVRNLLNSVEALEERERKLLSLCGPLDAVEWKEQKLKHLEERCREETERLSALEAAADIAGAKKKR